MSQIISVQSGNTQVSVQGMMLNANDKYILSQEEFDRLSSTAFTTVLTDGGPAILESLPISLSTISEANATIASWKPNFVRGGFISSVCAYVVTPPTTVAKSLAVAVFIDQDGGVDEVHTLSTTGVPIGGTFTLTYAGQVTTALAFNATAAAVQAALVALSNIAVGDVTCTGGPLPTPIVISYAGGSLAGTQIPPLVTVSSLTGGTAPTVTVVETTPGNAGTGVATQVNGATGTLTSANCAVLGSVVAFSNIGGGLPANIDSGAAPCRFNQFSTISIRSTGVVPTTFVEGVVIFQIILNRLTRGQHLIN